MLWACLQLFLRRRMDLNKSICLICWCFKLFLDRVSIKSFAFIWFIITYPLSLCLVWVFFQDILCNGHSTLPNYLIHCNSKTSREEVDIIEGKSQMQGECIGNMFLMQRLGHIQFMALYQICHPFLLVLFAKNTRRSTNI